MDVRKGILVPLVCVPLLSPGLAAAGRVDAYQRPAGSDLTYAFRGVTLSVEGASATVVSEDGYSTFNSRNLATTGKRVFGYEPPEAPIMSGNVWDQQQYGLLRIDFAKPVSEVQIDLIFDDDDRAALRAYDASGNLLGSVVGEGDGRSEVGHVTASIRAKTPSISYVTAGGVGREAVLLDNLRYKRK